MVFIRGVSKKRYNIYSVIASEMSSEKQGLFIYPNPGNKVFRDRVKELSGEKVELCFQCGACSSGCPMTQEMERRRRIREKRASPRPIR